MNFSEEVKSEIIEGKNLSLCCKKALLSAFLRTAGLVVARDGNVGIEFSSDSKDVARKIASFIKEIYGFNSTLSEGVDKFRKKGRTTYACVEKNSIYMLIDMGIIDVSDGEISIKLNIDWETVEDECCKVSFLKGAFLGSGSVTIPKEDGSSSTGYHLEFVFTNYLTATDFCELLSELYFIPKLIERKETFIVYFKPRDEISDLLAMMGASKAVLKLTGLAVVKEAKNNYNRKLNCEISNMSKQMGASAKQINAVMKIDEILGLESLPESLRAVAKARLENKDLTLSELAEALGISKSCLNHRLRKIVELSETL